MDIILLFNGLGNQMSQYAFYQQKKKSGKSTTYLIPYYDINHGIEIHKVFNIKRSNQVVKPFTNILFRFLISNKLSIVNTIKKRVLDLFNIRVIRDNLNYDFSQEFLKPSKGISIFYGGWLSEKYFIDIRDQIVKDFSFIKPVDPENVRHILNINSSNSVAIHVRRGDYLNAKNLDLFGRVCTKEYYKKAIDVIASKVASPHFFVFSNDLDWVKSNIQMKNATYVMCNYGENAWIDMYLMSICKHNIIANSTFSWWAAWLNTNTDKIVISPSRYLNNDSGHTDVYSESWIKLDGY